MVLKSSVILRITCLFVLAAIMLLSGGCEGKITIIGLTSANLTLTVEDIAVTEVSLRIRVDNPQEGISFRLLRSDSIIYNEPLITSDTRLYDKGLLPDHTYYYRVSLFKDGILLAQSAEQAVTTMDTTSHAFTWQTWTFGAKGSSVLYDCAIISHDNIWCVGKIYTEDTYTYDSLGNWIDPYNAIHWNGSEWELKRILYQGIFWTIEAIYAFSENDIWFEPFVHWDGNEFIEQPIPGILIGISINKMWGISSDDLYIVGNNGLIAHYNGQTWQRIESGTETNIRDIWGVKDTILDENLILIPALNKLYKIDDDNKVDDMNWAYADKLIRSVWFKNKFQVFGCGSYVFKKSFTKEWQEMQDIPNDNIYMTFIRGENVNDFFVVGNHGLVLHYNGTTWKRFFSYNNNFFWSVYYKNDVLVAVGDIWYSSPHESIILMMKRN